jgi:hypothetical protein
VPSLQYTNPQLEAKTRAYQVTLLARKRVNWEYRKRLALYKIKWCIEPSISFAPTPKCPSQYRFTPLLLASSMGQRNHTWGRPSTNTECYTQKQLALTVMSGGLRQVDAFISDSGHSSVTNRPLAKRCIGTSLSRQSDREGLQTVTLSGFPKVA